MSDCQSFYYALSVAEGVAIPDTLGGLVFEDRGQALAALKLLSGSQLKKFTSREAAEEYSGLRLPELVEPAGKEDGPEKTTVASFKSVPARELAPFRRSIEKGDTESVKQTIWANPRYLISSGDTAVILMAGPRYNACHVAAKADRGETLKLILETVSNKEFVRSLYVSDDDKTLSSRCQILLDCYLNTPDQGAHDTPLHFACKFGAASSVQVLLSYKECDRKKVNKFEKTAQQVICERKSDADVKRKIELLFEPQLYIPVIRTDDCIRVGRPENQICLEDEANVQAIAGPLSPPQAENLFQFLRSPHRKGNSADVRLSDQSKGVERMARVKCKEMGVDWAEWWPFLNRNIDLSSDNGLILLEKHLRSKECAFYDDKSASMADLSSALSNLQVSDELYVDVEDEGEIFVTAPSSPIPLEVFVQGSQFSAWDKNAFWALDNVNIDAVRFPLVKSWFERVSEKMKDIVCVTPLKTPKRYVIPARLAFTP